MSPFDLEASLDRARRRLGRMPATRGRAPRSDRGVSRLPAEVLAVVEESLSSRDRPPMKEMLSEIAMRCRKAGSVPPSRATVYKLMSRVPTPSLRVGDLPAAVQAALYNLVPESLVPAHQVVFYCFNYGDERAMSFAAGLPWLAIYQALRMPGHRKKSRGLMAAVARARGI